ncbi:MAG: insulinase family protein [Acidimicrobiales bacterium]|nr:insulinase family protein [Acidimicrobiales bacterium]
MTIERTDLPSGLAVVTEAVPGARSASFGCWVRVGGRDEPADRAGASHFLEHLLFKGTAARTGREISEAIESVGGEINAHTAHEHTAFYARVPAAAADVGLDLLVDVVTSPAFDDDDVESERQVILEELHLAEDEGDDRVLSLAHEALWGDHPLGREVLGKLDTIGAMDRAAIAGFFDQHYHPSNLVLVAAGAVDHRSVVAAGERFEPRQGGARPTRTAPVAPPRPERAALDRPHDVAHLALAWPGLPADHPDRYALSVANQIFGGGLSSRLFQEIREERGLAYSVFSAVSAYSDAGSLVTYAGTSPERSAEVVAIMRRVAADLAERGVTPREREVAVGYLDGAAQLSLEDTGSVMARLGNHVCARGTVIPIEEQLERLRAVTVDDIDRVAAQHLAGDPVLCVVGPLDDIGL